MDKTLRKFKVRHQLMYCQKKKSNEDSEKEQNALKPKFPNLNSDDQAKIKSLSTNHTIQKTEFLELESRQTKYSFIYKKNLNHQKKYCPKQIKSIDVQQIFKRQSINFPPFSNSLILQKVFAQKKVCPVFPSKARTISKNLQKLALSNYKKQKHKNTFSLPKNISVDGKYLNTFFLHENQCTQSKGQFLPL